MPARLLRDWTDSLRFDGISAEAERLFTRLIMKADDYGRFHAEPRLIKASCFPLLDNLRTPDLVRWLDELSTRQLILRYETEGRSLLAIVNFGQRLKQSRAKFPQIAGQPAEWLATSEHFRELPGTSGNVRPEEKGREGEAESEEGRGTPPPAEKPATLSPATMGPVDRVKAELRAAYPAAAAQLTASEMHALHGALGALQELTPADWLAIRAWLLAPDRIRGKAIWPKTRAQFLEHAGEAIEQIRTWWKADGGKWWNSKQPAPPKQTQPLQPLEEPGDSLVLWEQLKHDKKDPNAA